MDQRDDGRHEARPGEEDLGGQTSMPGPGTERGSTSASAPTRDSPRAAADRTTARTRGGGHVAVGYTDRRTLDDFLAEGGGDIVVRGPIRTDDETRDVSKLRAGATEGTPCLIVPLVHERIDEIRREVDSVLDRFGSGAPPGQEPARARGAEPRPDEILARARHDAERLRPGPPPRTIGETGAETRGGNLGPYRTGSARPDDESA